MSQRRAESKTRNINLLLILGLEGMAFCTYVTGLYCRSRETAAGAWRGGAEGTEALLSSIMLPQVLDASSTHIVFAEALPGTQVCRRAG